MVEERHFRDACDTGWGETAEEGPRGEGAGAGGEKFQHKRQKETKTQAGRVSRQRERGGCGEEISEWTTLIVYKWLLKLIIIRGPLSEGSDTARNTQRGREWAGRGQEEAM